jgi:hypothetical protein
MPGYAASRDALISIIAADAMLMLFSMICRHAAAAVFAAMPLSRHFRCRLRCH